MSVLYQQLPREQGQETVPVNANHPLPTNVLGRVDVASRRVVEAQLTRVADTNAYAAGDVIAQSTTAAATSPIVFNGVTSSTDQAGYITGLLFATDMVANVASYRLWLYTDVPKQIADNATNLQSWTDRLKAIGYIDFGPAAAENGSAAVSYAQDKSLRMFFKAAGTTIYGQLQAKTAFTPTSAQNFWFRLEIDLG